MLSMLLLLAVAPQVEAPRSSLLTPTVQQRVDAGAIPVQGDRFGPGVIGRPPANCSNNLIQTNEPIVPGADLRWRDGSPRVGLYRLLDRYIDGCPVPIIVNYRIGGSNAVGREAERAPEPLRPRP